MVSSADPADLGEVTARTQRQGLYVERRPVAGECSSCGGTELRGYPVHSEGGWFDVVKCQRCLRSMERNRGHRLGPIRLLSDEI